MSQYNQCESVYPIVLLRTAQVNTQLESRCLHAQSRELSHLNQAECSSTENTSV